MLPTIAYLYPTCIIATMNGSLFVLDEALLRLRRFTQAPARDRMPAPRESIEMSTVLVVDAVEHLAATSEPATVGAIAERLSVAQSTASRLIERASGAGMVERHCSPQDSRQVNVALTDGGRELAARAREFRHARLASLLATWPAERIERFAEDLRDFAQATLDHQDGDR